MAKTKVKAKATTKAQAPEPKRPSESESIRKTENQRESGRTCGSDRRKSKEHLHRTRNPSGRKTVELKLFTNRDISS